MRLLLLLLFLGLDALFDRDLVRDRDLDRFDRISFFIIGLELRLRFLNPTGEGDTERLRFFFKPAIGERLFDRGDEFLRMLRLRDRRRV